MSGISELFNRQKAKERAAAEARQWEIAQARQSEQQRQLEEQRDRQHRDEVERRAEPIRRQIESGHIPEFVDQAGEVLNYGNSDSRPMWPSKRSTYSGEESGRVYAAQTARHSNGGVDSEIEVRQYEDGEVEVIGEKRRRLRGRDAQDRMKLDRAIGEATENPKVTIMPYTEPGNV